VKAACTVILAGLAMMVPSVHDFLLATAAVAINWILELFHCPPLPKADYAPWWAGLILVMTGLFCLLLRGRKHVRIAAIRDEGGSVKIEGEVESSDSADAARLTQLMQDFLDNFDENE